MAQVPDTSVTYIGDGSNTNFAIPFDYLDGADVLVSVNSVDTPFTFSTPGTAFVSPAPAVGASVLVYRNTPALTVKNIFSDGVPFLTRLADMNWKYLLYAIQEVQSRLRDAVTDLLTLNSKTLRVSDTPLNTLPNQLTRQSTYVRFNNVGQPTVFSSAQVAQDIAQGLNTRLTFPITTSGLHANSAFSLVANPTGTATAPFQEVTLGAGLTFDTGTLRTALKTVNGEAVTGSGNIVIAPTVEAPFANRLALAAASLSIGQVVATAGCNTAGDGGAGKFLIEAPSGTPDGYSRILLANGNHAVLLVDSTTMPEQFGARNDGVTDDGDALRRFISRLGFLRLKAGLGYVYSGSIPLTKAGTGIVGEGSGVTKLIPIDGTDAYIVAARSAGVLRGFILNGFTIVAPSVSTNDTLVMDGVRNFLVNDVVIERGLRGLVLRGCGQGNFDNMTIIYENDNGGAISARRYIYIEETTNANIGAKHCGDLFFSNINGRCGAFPYCYAGLEIHSGDGIWFSNYHFGNCTYTNVHIKADRTTKCTGLKFINGWHDLGTGYGAVIEGSTPSINSHFQFNSVRCLGANTGLAGYIIDGSARDIKIGGDESSISAYQRQGIDIAVTFTGDITINDTDIDGVGLAGGYDAIVDRSATSKLKIRGGEIRGSTHRWGIVVQNGKADVDIDGVIVDAGTSGRISYTPTAGNRIRHCKGFNPRGTITETVGASPWTYTNILGYPVTMYVGGGTVSGISVDGQSTGLTSGTFTILDNGTVTITYSSVPTVRIRGH